MALYDANEMPRALVVPPVAVSRYRGQARPNWGALATILTLHGAAIWVLSMAGVIEVRRMPSELKVIQLSPEVAPPPAVVRAELPQQLQLPREVPVQALAPQLDGPVPIVSAPVPEPIVTAPVPPLTLAPAPIQTGPVRVADLDTTAITIIPPKYPLESRRRREQGTVVLSVTLSPDGSVDSVDLARSSGFERLDRAALNAVRGWRWSPTLRDGVPTAVKGTVDIPFILRG